MEEKRKNGWEISTPKYVCATESDGAGQKQNGRGEESIVKDAGVEGR